MPLAAPPPEVGWTPSIADQTAIKRHAHTHGEAWHGSLLA
ncbi:MAG: hypothetical protein JWP11_2766 [Frankiales bacterium]|nr:hypothetical protein [Frankiales bacterium]